MPKDVTDHSKHQRISYCGAWTKYGFHEDGFSSGLKVAMEHLDAKLPFHFTDSLFHEEEGQCLAGKVFW